MTNEGLIKILAIKGSMNLGLTAGESLKVAFLPSKGSSKGSFKGSSLGSSKGQI